MRKPSQYVQTGAATDIDSAMTPMIDVVFLLLVFFVWTASFQIIEQVMPSQLSQAAGSDPVENVQVPEPADFCLLYTSPSPRDRTRSRMPSSA